MISLIDCTLRDGGYLNNWYFSEELQIRMISSLVEAGIEKINCGFLSERHGYLVSGNIFKNITRLNSFLKEKELFSENTDYFVTMRLGECNPQYLPYVEKSGCVSDIQLMISKNEINDALICSEKLMEKGYRVHIYPTIISRYNYEDLVIMLKKFTRNECYSLAIVDTFGALDNDKTEMLASLFDKTMDKDLALSIYTSNSLHLAYSNVVEALNKINSIRNIMIESSINSVGLGAGNLSTQLVASYLNRGNFKHYKFSPLAQISNKVNEELKFSALSQNTLTYRYTAKLNMHPNYATYLDMQKYPSPLKLKILNSIEAEKYINFDFDYISNLCNNILATDSSENKKILYETII